MVEMAQAEPLPPPPSALASQSGAGPSHLGPQYDQPANDTFAEMARLLATTRDPTVRALQVGQLSHLTGKHAAEAPLSPLRPTQQLCEGHIDSESGDMYEGPLPSAVELEKMGIRPVAYKGADEFRVRSLDRQERAVRWQLHRQGYQPPRPPPPPSFRGRLEFPGQPPAAGLHGRLPSPDPGGPGLSAPPALTAPRGRLRSPGPGGPGPSVPPSAAARTGQRQHLGPGSSGPSPPPPP